MTLSACLILSAFLFVLGAFGLMERRNLVGLLISIELMLNAASSPKPSQPPQVKRPYPAPKKSRRNGIRGNKYRSINSELKHTKPR